MFPPYVIDSVVKVHYAQQIPDDFVSVKGISRRYFFLIAMRKKYRPLTGTKNTFILLRSKIFLIIWSSGSLQRNEPQRNHMRGVLRKTVRRDSGFDIRTGYVMSHCNLVLFFSAALQARTSLRSPCLLCRHCLWCPWSKTDTSFS